MNKTIAYVIGAVVVAIIIVLIVMGRGGSGDGSDTSGGDNGGTISSQSLKALYASGKSQKCTFEAVDASGQHSSGIVYVSSGHMRGDFSSEVKNGDAVESHMIVMEDGTAYMWSSATPQGVKMSFTNVSGQSSGPGALDANNNYEYSCTSWSEDHEKFDLPAGVTFIDLGKLMPAGAGAGAGAGAAGGLYQQ